MTPNPLCGTWSSPDGVFELTLALTQRESLVHGRAEFRGPLQSLEAAVTGTVASSGIVTLTFDLQAGTATFVGSLQRDGTLHGGVHDPSTTEREFVLHRDSIDILDVHRVPLRSADTGQTFESLTGQWTGSDGEKMQLSLLLEQHRAAIHGTAILTDGEGGALNFDVAGTTGTAGFSLRLRDQDSMMELRAGPIAANRLIAVVVHEPSVSTPITFFLRRDEVAAD